MNTYTIGFTNKPAERFFHLLSENHVKRVVDVRLHNVSQLSGFAKRDDLRFFLRELCSVDYVPVGDLAPTKDILDAYKKKEIKWDRYENEFLNLMARRRIERTIQPDLLIDGCLLCSEHEPHYCHRRLVVEYLNAHWETKLNVLHLV
jgi:uncharacterized protein (DUF488 family)